MERLILAALLSLFAFAVPAGAAACCDGGLCCDGGAGACVRTRLWPIAVRRFSGHECGEVVEAKRLPDGTIRAECHSGEFFRVAFMDDAPIALWCAEAENHGIKDCSQISPSAAHRRRPVPQAGTKRPTAC
jgi:hypothetical protein